MSSLDLSESHLGWWDLGVILIYFLFIIGVGAWSSRKNTKGSISSYFLASRSMHWIPVGASLFSSNIGSVHFIGLAGAGAATGIGAAGYELGSVFILMMLGWLFTPVYLSAGVYTMPEYLSLRFGGQRIRIYMAFLSLILYIFTKISVDLYAGALFIQMALNKNTTEWLYISIVILIAIAAIFTIVGGLTVVMWTDFFQTILMIGGSFILMVKAFSHIDGFNALFTKYPYAVPKNITSLNQACGIPPYNYMSLLRAIEPGKSDYPWTGMLFGFPIICIWYWCTDQVIVQRTLSSRNLTHAKAGCILASYLKILPLWLIVFPGMAARILFPDRVGCTDPEKCLAICGSPGSCSNIAYVELVLRLLPPGLSGMMMAVMMAALMSSLTSIFNSASTIFTIDVWKRYREHASETELIVVGRIAIVVLMVTSVIWIPVIQNAGGSKLFDYIMSMQSLLAPSICAVFLLAIFWERINEQGAFWALVLGLLVGIIRFILELSFPPLSCGSEEKDTRPEIVKLLVDNVQFLHFSCILFLLSGAIAVAISLVTKPIPEFCLYRLTYWSRSRPEVRKNIDEYFSKSEDVISSKAVSQMEIDERPNHSSDCFGICKKLNVVDSEAVETNEEFEKTEKQKAKDAADFLNEDPRDRLLVNVNAVICVCITIFICGFFV